MPAPRDPFEKPPAPGTAVQVAPGGHWRRMALPFERDHIKRRRLEDGDAGEPHWFVGDTGRGSEPASFA